MHGNVLEARGNGGSCITKLRENGLWPKHICDEILTRRMFTLRSAFLTTLVISKEFSFIGRGYFKTMDVLPKNAGPFQVGCTDFMTEKTFSNSFTKDSMIEIPGYFMRFFYPAENAVADKFERAKWIPKGLYADGFATFIHLPVWVFGRINRWLMGKNLKNAYENGFDPVMHVSEIMSRRSSSVRNGKEETLRSGHENFIISVMMNNFILLNMLNRMPKSEKTCTTVNEWNLSLTNPDR